MGRIWIDLDSSFIKNSFENCRITNGTGNLHTTLKAIANNLGYSNFEDFVDEAVPSGRMDGFDGRGASVYDQEYDSEKNRSIQVVKTWQQNLK